MDADKKRKMDEILNSLESSNSILKGLMDETFSHSTKIHNIQDRLDRHSRDIASLRNQFSGSNMEDAIPFKILVIKNELKYILEDIEELKGKGVAHDLVKNKVLISIVSGAVSIVGLAIAHYFNW